MPPNPGRAAPPICSDLIYDRHSRNYLWFRQGDANNAVLAAAGYNFRRLIHWLRLLFRQILSALLAEPVINPARNQGSSRTTNQVSVGAAMSGARRPAESNSDGK